MQKIVSMSVGKKSDGCKAIFAIGKNTEQCPKCNNQHHFYKFVKDSSGQKYQCRCSN